MKTETTPMKHTRHASGVAERRRLADASKRDGRADGSDRVIARCVAAETARERARDVRDRSSRDG